MSNDARRSPNKLRTEYLIDPIGLDEPEPRFSWSLDDNRRGATQTAYQILVASSPATLARDSGDFWDSGMVRSEEVAHIVYAGRPLQAFDAAHWKVRSWDHEDVASPWSSPASFELGPLTGDDWKGALFIWSPVVGDSQTGAPSPYFRRPFRVDGADVVRARLYITALGLYEATINGLAVTDAVFRPGWTDYDRRVPYQAYDVTNLVIPGDNVIGVILGDGWYCGTVSWQRQQWGERPELLAQLVISTQAKSDQIIITNTEWRTATGPILRSDHYHGEEYDARLEHIGWNEPGFDDSHWLPASTDSDSYHFRRSLVATIAPPVRPILEIATQTVTQRGAGTYQFDLGQNVVGWARLRVAAPEGTALTLRFAEMLNDDGTLHTANLLSARATDRYTCRGGREETYEPRFTYHGFRYVEVSGVPPQINLGAEAITGVVISTDSSLCSEFECSNALLNRLQQNVVSSQRGNFFDVPTDNPQRAERLGWLGDARAFARTATYNMDVAAFFTKFVIDMRDGQLVAGSGRGSYPWFAPSITAQAGGPGWADAGVVIPWVLYERYADVRVLERHYSSILDYLDFLDRAERGRTPGTWLGFGDWLALEPEPVYALGVTDDRFGSTPREYLWQAFDIDTTTTAARIAAKLGREDDARRFRERAERLRNSFQSSWVDGHGRLTVATQTAHALALAFDLLTEPEHRKNAADSLVQLVTRVGHLQTGQIGTPLVLQVLSDIGEIDLAYKLLERTEYPSWLYPVTQGATTIWERWDGWTRQDGFKQHTMNSFNQYHLGTVGEWMFRTIAGIDTSTAGTGYKHIVIHPRPGGSLTSARAHLDTIRGRIATHWRREQGYFHLDLQLPPATTATLHLPSTDLSRVTESSAPLTDVDGVTGVRTSENGIECDLVPGTYSWRVDES
jgi:alpha-L-rhamnosidase